MRRASRMIPLIAVTVALSGCERELPTGPSLEPERDEIEMVVTSDVGDGLEVRVEELVGGEAGTRQYRVRVVGGEDVEVASYQGQIRLPAGAFELVRVDLPVGGDGEFRVVNTEGFGEGEVRFAAFALERFEIDEAFTLVVKVLNEEKRLGVRAMLEVAADAESEAYAPDQLRGTEGLLDEQGKRILR